MRNKAESLLSRTFTKSVDETGQLADQYSIFLSTTGIAAVTYIKNSVEDPSPRVDGKVWKFKKGILTYVDFEPDERCEFDPAKRSDSLLQAISGLDELTHHVDTLRFTAAPTLLGYTNPRMAIIAQRMGFRIVDEDKDKIARLRKDAYAVLIIARYEDVAKKAREFAKSDMRKRLAARVSRLELS